jgi:acyl dehydratase
MKVLDGIEGVREMEGQELGAGSWRPIDQEQVNEFADVTDDHQWIHVDVDRARSGPFGTPIAHGYLTLSLIPSLTREIVRVEGIKMTVNYGLNRVRFPAPVPVGSRIRASMKNLSVEEVQGGLQAVNQVTIEIEGQGKPACVADMVSRYYT